jgi:hypothetical protein
VILSDFFIPTADEQALVIPHLRQFSHNAPQRSSEFLQVGASISGVVYFEGPKSLLGNFILR